MITGTTKRALYYPQNIDPKSLLADLLGRLTDEERVVFVWAYQGESTWERIRSAAKAAGVVLLPSTAVGL